MSEILSELITPQVRFVGILILVFIAILYVLSVVWVVRDAYLRGSSPTIWGVIALVPFLGCLVYAMLRPPLYASDREEQNIGLLLQQRELMQYGECPQCGYPTERSYILCPNCHTRLRDQCSSCGHTLEPEWTICPYCGNRAHHASVSDYSRSRYTSNSSRYAQDDERDSRGRNIYSPVETTVETIEAEESASVDGALPDDDFASNALGSDPSSSSRRSRTRTSSIGAHSGRNVHSRTSSAGSYAHSADGSQSDSDSAGSSTFE